MSAVSAPCASSSESGSSRNVQARDLVSLRDIGGMADTEPPFSISPDGRKVALTVRQGDADRNVYCTTLYIIDIRSRKIDLELPIDGEPILGTFDRPPVADFGTGAIETIIPRWSPDGERLALLLRREGRTQVWMLPSAGGTLALLSRSTEDVRGFRWSETGAQIIFTVRTPPHQTQEGLQGYRYDDRWLPNWGPAPRPPATPFQTFAIGVEGRHDVLPIEAERIAAEPRRQRASTGAEAWIGSKDPRFVNSATTIVIRRNDGTEMTCADAICSDVEQIWFGDNGSTLFFLSRAGWARSLTKIYSWPVTRAQPRLLYQTRDLISGCASSRTDIICAAESAAVPRRLITIGKATGDRTLLFDPNPQWHSLKVGSVRHLEDRNQYGLPYFAELVLPPGTGERPKLPLVIVGYYARGFLRGGVGDSYPIFPLASAGYAVLVYNRPVYYGLAQPVKTTEESTRIGVTNWMDKRSVSSAILTTVDRLVREEIVDPKRIGITGFSDGADKARYMLVHSPIFAAAAISSCCDDPVSLRAMLGPLLTKSALAMGYPGFDYGNVERTKEYSLAANAHRIRSPLLIQTSDREYLYALESEQALRANGKPVALYVFPDEYHIFWQPAHRLAAYDRSIAWFNFWMLDKSSGPASMITDIGSWRSLQEASTSLKIGTNEAAGLVPSRNGTNSQRQPVPRFAESPSP
ncbi:Atxe2 family lasso peptide isopeptidase [Sphingobium sp. TKS]|uniref:Atxe2 family lasso peptide isopeptidase n=2 Tax=Sphingomonadaceae TaxID=41297 RepID=UPI00214FCEF5|nr:Atxe2 family lasso peptide isopeptidase [Sphingobium sp. TKS]